LLYVIDGESGIFGVQLGGLRVMEPLEMVYRPLVTLLFASPLRQPRAANVVVVEIVIELPFATAVPVPDGVQPVVVPGVEPSVV
jgi:hypothetical protein